MGLLDKVIKQQRGPWNHGWYASAVAEEMELRDGTVLKTQDTESTKGDSRNLNLVLVSVNNGQVTKNPYRINYRPESLFDEARRNEVIGNREANMRDHIALEHLKDVESALGSISPNGNGGIDVHQYIGKECRVYLGVYRANPADKYNPLPVKMSEVKDASDEEKARWFNQVTQIGPATAPKK